MYNMNTPGTEDQALVIDNKDVTINIETQVKNSNAISLLLLYVLSCEEKLKALSFVLTQEDIKILNKIISYSPGFFNEIDKLINEIIKDGKIDSNDIPNLIFLIKKLFELIHNVKDLIMDPKKHIEVCSNLLKFVIRTLIEERIVILNDEKKVEIIVLMDKLIDSSISLINCSNIKNSSCYKNIKSIFGF